MTFVPPDRLVREVLNDLLVDVLVSLLILVYVPGLDFRGDGAKVIGCACSVPTVVIVGCGVLVELSCPGLLNEMVKVLDANLSAFYDRTVNRFEVFARGTVNLCWANIPQIFTNIAVTIVSNLCCSAVSGGIGIVGSTIERVDTRVCKVRDQICPFRLPRWLAHIVGVVDLAEGIIDKILPVHVALPGFAELSSRFAEELVELLVLIVLQIRSQIAASFLVQRLA